MPISYVIDKRNRLVLTTAEGRVTLDDVLQSRRQLLSDPDFDPSFSQLGDLSAVTGTDITADEVRIVAENSPFSLTGRRALVGESPEIYGLARMFSILRDLHGEREIRVFRTRHEALLWLLFKRDQAA